MPLFKKRESLVQNIAYMAIMAAINVVFVLLTTFVPVLMVLLVLVLPLTNVVVTLFCKKKYFPIYALVTIGLCMLVTMGNISDTFLYVIPSIITGFIFGIMVEKRVPAIYILLITSIIQFTCAYAIIPYIEFVYKVQIINTFLSAFGLGDYVYKDYIVAPFIAFLAIAQSTLAYIFIKREIPKLGFEVTVDENKFYFILPLLELVSIGLFCLIAYLVPSFSYTFLVLAIFVATYLITDMFIGSTNWIWISSFLAVVVSIFMFAIFYQSVPKPFGVSLIMILFILLSIIAIVNNYLFKVIKNKSRIK